MSNPKYDSDTPDPLESELRSIKPRGASFNFEDVETVATKDQQSLVAAPHTPNTTNWSGLLVSGLVGLAAGICGTLICLSVLNPNSEQPSPAPKLAITDDTPAIVDKVQLANELSAATLSSPRWNALGSARAVRNTSTLTPFSDFSDVDVKGHWIRTTKKPATSEATSSDEPGPLDGSDFPIESTSPANQRELLRNMLGSRFGTT